MKELNEKDIKARIDSYVNKEEFLKILNDMEFIAVKDVSISLITSFIVKTNSDGNQYLDSLYKDFRIE